MGGGDGGPANACFTCHGLDGAGDGVSVPRLAGLDAGYLQKQMQDYGNDLRQNTVMQEVARRLDDDGRRAVSRFYADMPPPVSTGTTAPAPPVYLHGNTARAVPPCASCHGGDGLGVGFGHPALAGQPAAYTVDQLLRWKSAKRRNDARGVMIDAVRGLTDAEIIQIAAWLERAPSARPPDSDVASASVAASASARAEASRGVRRRDQ